MKQAREAETAPGRGRQALSGDDKLALADLVYEYARAADAGDLDGVLTLFTDDAVMSSPTFGIEVKGRDQIGVMYGAVFGRLERSFHLVSNHSAWREGDIIRGSCNFIGLELYSDGSTMRNVGRYDDVYRREGGAWKFAERSHLLTFQLDVQFALPVPRALNLPGAS